MSTENAGNDRMKDPCDRKGVRVPFPLFEVILCASRIKNFSVLMNMLMTLYLTWQNSVYSFWLFLTAVVNPCLESECKISSDFSEFSITARPALTISKYWTVLMSFTVSGMVVIRFKTMFNDVQWDSYAADSYADRVRVFGTIFVFVRVRNTETKLKSVFRTATRVTENEKTPKIRLFPAL